MQFKHASTFAPADSSLYLDEPEVLSSGKLCLEFANTANWHASAEPQESLHHYQDLLEWAHQTGICTDEAAHALKVEAAAYPPLADQVYRWAIELREAIYRTFAALADSKISATDDLALINEALPLAYSRPEIVMNGERYALRWRADEKGLDSILWPILRSTARLLTEGDHERIKQCADDRGCGYLFFDTTRNRSRRWCDMSSCGNRAKSQRHYARHRHTDAG